MMLLPRVPPSSQLQNPYYKVIINPQFQFRTGQNGGPCYHRRPLAGSGGNPQNHAMTVEKRKHPSERNDHGYV